MDPLEEDILETIIFRFRVSLPGLFLPSKSHKKSLTPKKKTLHHVEVIGAAHASRVGASSQTELQETWKNPEISLEGFVKKRG